MRYIPAFSSYEALAARYMSRNLAYESDRLNGFSRILSEFPPLQGERYIWGLPESRFSSALIWKLEGQPRTGALHTRVSEDGTVLSVPLPSWSWVAWRVASRFG